MKLYVDDALKRASNEEAQQVLNMDIFLQEVSMWKPSTTGDGFYFSKNIQFNELIKHIIQPDLLHPELKNIVEKVVKGEATKSELFGFCVATFKTDVDGKVRRLKNNHSTYTKLVQLDLDLKNEPNCDEEYVEGVINHIWEHSGLAQNILLSGKSISKKGIYLYLLCDTEEVEVLEVVIEKVYAFLNKQFRFQNPSKTLDTSVKDIVNRLRYYAPDANLVINPNVQPIDTSLITLKKKTYSSTYVPKIGNTFREFEIIRQGENRFLIGYDNKTYISGFHSDFLCFANSCIGKGVSRATLERYTQHQYGQLYNQEKRKNYLPELMRIIDCAEKNIIRT